MGLVALGGLVESRVASAQVIQLEAGADTYVGGLATVARFWGPSYDGWIGVGEQNGMRLGGFARVKIGRDTLRIGNDFLSLDYPTDVFNLGHAILLQGATWQVVRSGTRTSFFAGTNATGTGTPLFAAQRAGQALAGVTVSDSISARFRLHGRLLLTTRQSMSSGVEWSAAPRSTAAATFGLGANRPFAAASYSRIRAHYEVKTSAIAMNRGYRRAYLDEPPRSRLDGPAFELRLHPSPSLSLSVTRQTFVRDSALATRSSRATGTSFVVATSSGATHATLAVSMAETPARTDHSGYAAVGRGLGSRVTVDLYLLAVSPQDRPLVVTPIVSAREQIASSLRIEQVLTVGGDHQTLSLGGNWMGALTDLSLGYQIVHAPLLLETPFLRTLYVALRFNVGEYAAHVTTTVLPTGETRYSASISTYLYPGGGDAGQPALVTPGLPPYLVQGIVTDESGAPVRGAALAIGTVPLFSDRTGRFFLRVRSRRPLPFTVVLNEFTVAGQFALVSAPALVTPATDATAAVVGVVVRRLP